jgi:hypothetical protein
MQYGASDQLLGSSPRRGPRGGGPPRGGPPGGGPPGGGWPRRDLPGLEPPGGGTTGGVPFGALPPGRGRPARREDTPQDAAASGSASAPQAPAVSTKREGIRASRCLAGASLAKQARKPDNPAPAGRRGRIANPPSGDATLNEREAWRQHEDDVGVSRAEATPSAQGGRSGRGTSRGGSNPSRIGIPAHDTLQVSVDSLRVRNPDISQTASQYTISQAREPGGQKLKALKNRPPTQRELGLPLRSTAPSIDAKGRQKVRALS